MSETAFKQSLRDFTSTRSNPTVVAAYQPLGFFPRVALSSTPPEDATHQQATAFARVRSWFLSSPPEQPEVGENRRSWESHLRLELSRTQRLTGFVVLAAFGTICLASSLFVLPIVVLSPQKFAFLYSAGSLSLYLACRFFWFPSSAPLASAFSGNYLPLFRHEPQGPSSVTPSEGSRGLVSRVRERFAAGERWWQTPCYLASVFLTLWAAVVKHDYLGTIFTCLLQLVFSVSWALSFIPTLGGSNPFKMLWAVGRSGWSLLGCPTTR